MAGSPTSLPRVTISLSSGAISDTFEDRRDIIFGQNQGGTAVSDALNTDLHLADDADILALFGAGEMYWRIRKWREGAQISDGGPLPGLDAVAAPAAGGTAATATVVFTGPATAEGSITFTIVDEDEFTFTLDTSDETADEIGDLFDAAVLALDSPPFTSSNTSGTVVVTATDASTTGGDYGIRITDNTLVGATATISVAWTSGAGISVLTNIFDNIEDIRYTGVGWPESWPSTTIITEMDARFNVSNDILDGVAFQGSSDTFALNTTAVSTLNSLGLVLMGNNVVAQSGTFTGPAILTPADWVASEFMAIRDKRLTTGAIIADFIVAANAGFDTTGGPALASLPYFNTEITAAPVTSALNLYSSSEQIELEADGFTVFGVNQSGDGMVMGPVVTTRVNDDAGISNTSFLYLNFVDTASVCREIFFNTLKSTFAQTRLTEGNIIPGRSMANEQSIKAELLSIYRALANEALTQAGSDAEAFFAAETTVTVSLADRLATINGPLPIVSQLETINYSLSLTFDIDASGTFTF